ncbi:MAG: hypothetical protein CO189_07645 [candidate division Zixibacteria bacterium CG_4_9_14_3_um_filter_46_8]|nr:MAG: hypothetical protein CO189_07645 [candidate division Zixibacteria bacterium CG_4_9_14_3_um_filter_46_8]
MTSRILGILFINLAMSAAALGGEYHSQTDIICSDCHTTHYSERGALPEHADPGGPFSTLLLVASADRLCLSCHDGTDPTAPDVLAPVTMYNGSGSEFSGAGYFSAPEGTVSAIAHDLGVDTPVPFSVPPRSMIISCISCHDPHSTSNYRNMILNPDSAGAPINIALDTDVFENFRPQVPPNRSATIAAYRSDNIGYRSGMANWCADCHDALFPNAPGNPPAHFQRHPSDAGQDGSGYHVNVGHWMNGSGDGFGITTGDNLEGVPRLRFQAPTATNYGSAVTPASNNQIFCNSCHFAHGGPYDSGLLWPFKIAGEADLYSGCQQCHYK